MRIELAFEIRLDADFHLGAGHGAGPLVDTALLRDGDGVPVIRGTALAGLLRDGLSRLLREPPLAAARARTCDVAAGNCRGSDPCIICRLFGSPAQPKLWRLSSARALQEGAAAVEWSDGLHSQVVRRVRVDPRTRRAEDGKLFAEEEGSSALRFRFTATRLTPDAGDEDAWDEAAALVAAARMVRHLGSGRRRGRGTCSVALVGTGPAPVRDQANLLNRFQHRWIEAGGQDAPVRPAAESRRGFARSAARSGPMRLRLLVSAQEPLLLARRAEAGHAFETMTEIPGTTLIGALAGFVAGRSALDAADDGLYRRFVEIFRQGRVRFPVLYPALRLPRSTALQLVPTLPAPLDLLTCKGFPGFESVPGDLEHHGVFAASALAEIPERCPRCAGEGYTVPLVPIGGYLPLRAQRLSPWRGATGPDRRTEMHLRLDESTGRAAAGDLYAYVAVERGSWFAGELLAESEEDWRDLCELAGLDCADGEGTFELRLGKAAARGYGRVRVEVARLSGDDDFIFCPAPLHRRVGGEARTVAMTLLTDAILTDPWGRFRQTLDEEALSELLGWEVEVLRAAAASREVDGFYGHTGLPRWRDLALRAGSAVGFRLPDGPDRDAALARLREVERDGIGLRRGEGFGRVAFNHPIYGGCADCTNSIMPTRQVEPAARSAGPDDDRARARAALETVRLTRTHFADDRWREVARWLIENAGREPKDLREELKTFGRSEALHREIGRPLKPTHFQSEDANRKGIGEVIEVLGRIGAASEGEDGLTTRQRRLAVERLSGMIAQAVGGEGRD